MKPDVINLVAKIDGACVSIFKLWDLPYPALRGMGCGPDPGMGGQGIEMGIPKLKVATWTVKSNYSGDVDSEKSTQKSIEKSTQNSVMKRPRIPLRPPRHAKSQNVLRPADRSPRGARGARVPFEA